MNDTKMPAHNLIDALERKRRSDLALLTDALERKQQELDEARRLANGECIVVYESAAWRDGTIERRLRSGDLFLVPTIGEA